jgi:capsid protein
VTKAVLELKDKLAEAKSKASRENNESVKTVLQKNAEIIQSTLDRLIKNKETIANKLQKTEDSRVVLAAKKNLLDSIESLKGMSSNVFDGQDFDVDAIMAEIDKSIRDIEADFQADDELNDLVKK